MKTSITTKTMLIPALDTWQSCYCGNGKRGQSCDKCGFVAKDESVTFEIGTVWECVETSRHGSATYSYPAEDYEMRETRLLAALRRAVGRSVDIGWGHYGKNAGTGLSPIGTYETYRI